MIGNTLSMDIRTTLSDSKDNLDTLKRLGASLESLQQTIVQDGMSRGVAQVLEQHSPGCITETSRINGFTQYPSQVGRNTGLEAISTVYSKSIKGIIVAIISAAAAALGAFLVYLIKRWSGREYIERKQRSTDRTWQANTPAQAGASRPQWRDDMEFKAASDAFMGTINMLLLNTGAGQYTPFLKEVFTVKPRALFDTLSDHITAAVRLARDTTNALANTPLAVVSNKGNDEILNAMQRLYQELGAQYTVLEALKPQGVPGRGVLSERLLNMRSAVEIEANKSGVTRDYTLSDAYAFRGVINEGIAVLENLRIDTLMREMNDNAKALQKTLDDIDNRFANFPGRAADVLIEAMLYVQRMLEMQADLIGIVSTLIDNVLQADTAYCQLLRTQIEAMGRAGIRFNGNEPEFAEDRKFYKEARKFLG